MSAMALILPDRKGGSGAAVALPTLRGVGSSPSRYDEIAEWYCAFTRDWPSEPIAVVPAGIQGHRVLDMACGYGVASRHLASHGADVTAVDLSSKLLERAMAMETLSGSGI